MTVHVGSATESAALGLALRIWAATHGVVSLESAGLLGDEAPAMLDDLVSAALAAAWKPPQAWNRVSDTAACAGM